MTLVITVKQTIQDYHNMYRTEQAFAIGKRDWAQSKNEKKWEFVAEEQAEEISG